VGVALLAVALFFAPVAVGHTGAEIDRAAQTLTARGAAAADLRAPSGAIARVKAARQARAQAEKKLAAALVELGANADPDALGKIVSGAVADERYGSDGSVELTLTLATKDLVFKKPRHHKKEKEADE
jgi:hypothetical protein